MWKRLKVKVTGSSLSSGKTRLDRGSVTTSVCDDKETHPGLDLDIDLDLSKDDHPDVVKDSWKMSFPYLDKCSCGSPGFGGKEGFRKTDSLIAEINRRNEGERRESFETARNEYTLFDDRKRPTTTTTMITTTNTVSSSSSSLTNATTPTITWYKGVLRSGGNEDKARAGSSSKESKEAGTRTRNAIQRSSVGIEDSESEEEEEEQEEAAEEENEREPEVGGPSPEIETETGRGLLGGGRGGQRDSGGSEDYTSLAFDVNYVKVSPPKMTRRNKSKEEQKQPKRGSRLAGLAMTSPDDVRPEAEQQQRSCRSVLPPSVNKVVESPAMTMTSRPNKPEVVSSSASVHETSPHRKQFYSSSSSSSSQSSSSAHATEYISLQDLQNRINIPVINNSKAEVDVAPQCPAPRPTVPPVADPLDQPGDSVTLIQDGDSSVLEFTFTVRLENDVIRRMRPEDAGGGGGSNSGSPVVSGSVNILKSSSDVKPVVTVGLRSVSVDGDAAARSSGDLNGTGNETMSVAAISRNHFAAEPKCDRSGMRPETKPEVEGSRTWSENNDDDDDDGRCCWSEAVKTVTWSSVDRSRANPDRTPSVRKRQTLADFMSSQQQQQQQQQQQHNTKITTVAIVHKPADFDESKSKSEAEVTLPSRGSTPVVSPSGGGGGGCHRVARTSIRKPAPATEKEPELTHMSWDEVMTEARALGIPLQRPGSGTTTARRLDRQASVDDQKTSWTCPGCAQDEAAAAPGGRPSENKTHAKKASPFKDKFKFQNLFFSRRSKGDEDGVGKSRDQSAFSSKHIITNSGSKGCNTVPARSGSGLDDSKRCVPDAKSGSHGKKTTASPPSRIQSPFKMLSFSGTSGHRRSAGNGDGTAEGSRSGREWNNCQTAGKVTSGSWNAAEYHKDNTITKPVSTLSPKQRSGTNNDFLKSLEQLKACGWYWGPLGFDEAEVRLSGKPDGAFLVRDSSDDRYILSLSFNSQGTTHHTRIEHYRGMFSFHAQQSSSVHEAATIVDFIENAMRNSQDGKCLYYLRPRSPTRPPAPVQLIFPVSRFRAVPSMKQLAQAAILRHVRRSEGIERLPLSKADRGSLKRLHRLRR